MVWWISLGLVVAAPVLLGLVVLVVLRRSRPLREAARAARERQPAVQRLQEEIATMRQAVAATQARAASTRAGAAAIGIHRGR